MTDLRVTIAMLNEIEAIKRLLVLQLVSSGIRVEDVARSLGIRAKEVRRWIPKEWKSP